MSANVSRHNNLLSTIICVKFSHGRLGVGQKITSCSDQRRRFRSATAQSKLFGPYLAVSNWHSHFSLRKLRLGIAAEEVEKNENFLVYVGANNGGWGRFACGGNEG